MKAKGFAVIIDKVAEEVYSIYVKDLDNDKVVSAPHHAKKLLTARIIASRLEQEYEIEEGAKVSVVYKLCNTN